MFETPIKIQTSVDALKAAINDTRDSALVDLARYPRDAEYWAARATGQLDGIRLVVTLAADHVTRADLAAAIEQASRNISAAAVAVMQQTAAAQRPPVTRASQGAGILR